MWQAVLLVVLVACERSAPRSQPSEGSGEFVGSADVTSRRVQPPQPLGAHNQGGCIDDDEVDDNCGGNGNGNHDNETGHDHADDDDGGCGSLSAPVPDLYLALTRGSADEKAAAALRIVQTRSDQSRSIVRRAIVVISGDPRCAHLRPLTDTLRDCVLDETTRAAAALALGEIAAHHPCTFPAGNCSAPHNPIPMWSKQALRSCALSKKTPLMVRRACAEAMGFVPTSNIAELTALRDDKSKDTMLRVFAGRAISRLTHAPAVTVESLDQLIDDAHRIAKQR